MRVGGRCLGTQGSRLPLIENHVSPTVWRMSKAVEPRDEFRCPGQTYPISRSTHLARMARFYPACRTCPLCDDTAPHSAGLVRRIAETRFRAHQPALFDADGPSGVFPNDIGPKLVRRLAAALGLFLRPPGIDVDAPVVLVAGDGRTIMPELVAAALAGLEWSGSNVVDIGRASAGSMAFAVAYFQADGGLLLGNPGWRSHLVGVRFWGRGGTKLVGRSLEAIETLQNSPMDRPTRRFGALGRLQADEFYLAALEPHYHALRPLRFVLATTCGPLVEHLEHLTAPLGCRIVRHGNDQQSPADAIRRQNAHFGVRIDGFGQRCELWDERAQAVPWSQIVSLLGGAQQTTGASSADLSRPWHDADRLAGDALVVLSGLLVVLSRNDYPLSRVVCDA